MEKYCKRCDTTKSVSEFYTSARSKDGLTIYCRPCDNQLGKEYYEKNKERVKKRKKEWREKNPDKRKEHVDRSRLRQYGLTIEDYNDLLAQQNNRCAVCREESENGKALYVDHDHSCCKGKGSCGKCVRGLLCNSCNSMLGYAKDDPERLEAGKNYVKSRSKAKISEMISDHQNF